jgi:PAS domain S-box-containing protein
MVCMSVEFRDARAPRSEYRDSPPADAPRPGAELNGQARESGCGLEAQRSIDQRLFETSLDLIAIVDRWGNIIRVSPSARAILGYDVSELTGQSAVKLLYPDDLENTRNEMRLARRGRTMRNFDCRYVRKDGRVVTLAWTGVWSEPEQQHFFVGRDMTERIKLEQQLAQSQKMEAIGQLTGGIAHDFNNILTVVIGMNEILSSAVAGNPKLAEVAKSVDEAAERGSRLVQRMLAFARKQALKAHILDLNEIVAGMAAMLAQSLGEHIGVETALCEGLWPTLADPSRLEDAILNLAVNARDAMPKGGRLLIETANIHLDEQYAQANVEVTPGDYVGVFVTDSGTGTPPEVIERAFEPFFTTKEVGRGTGLGLSMVYGFAKQSRGHVKIYSEVGHGTSIKLYLPRAAGDSAAATLAAPAAAETNAGGRESILVVEDDAAVRSVAVNVLESLGYQVRQAADGRAALQILQQTDAIDLLFTDLVMPNGIGGQDLLRMARERRPGLKAIFTSGYSDNFLKGQGEADQSIPLLPKPYRKQKLVEAIRTVLDTRS